MQGGLGLPDESFYREDSFAEHRAKYVAHVAAMLRLLGRSPERADDEARRLMALETRLAASHWDRVRCRDVLATYNLTTLDEARAAAPAFDWTAWIAAMGGTQEQFAEVVVRQPSFLPAMSAALTDIPLDDWKIWLTFHLLSSAAPYLSRAFVDENFEFYLHTLTGADAQRDRWKRGVRLCDRAIGEAVGAEYVARVLPPEAKAEMEELIANLLEAYRVSIGRLTWMSAETRERALEKLARFRSKIGYPNTWRDYSALTIVRDDLIGNVRRAAAFEVDRELGKLGGPVDRDEWFMTPQTVNAYYHPRLNEIVFPAAILQPPFFDPDADDAANYGGIGAVIGHEIGHGYDDQGREYDETGKIRNWWTPETNDKFMGAIGKFAEQYNAFCPLEGACVNGNFTMGENIGDLGGLEMAYTAYKLSLGGKEAPVLDGFTGDQRFFMAHAQVWRAIQRDDALRNQMLTDPHSPAAARGSIPERNVDAWYAAFDVKPGDAQYIAPENRVRIW
jgi:predicted metalloendopeptidase